MGLDIIGAGFGRTGTESMKRALETLGYAPCYHMYEVMPDPARYALWTGIYDGTITPDWDAVFADFRATVDWPACRYWRELAAHFPQAKILLTVRSSESWYVSMENTILKSLRDPDSKRGLGHRIMAQTFGGNVDDKDHVIAAYERNIADVQAAFGPDRLLTYELGSGWAPLCTFLGVTEPATPYPSGNSADAFFKKDEVLSAQRKAQEDPT